MFLEESDFKTHLYAEIISAVERGEDGLLEKAVNTAIEEVQGYLSRYDIEDLFAQTGDDRKSLLLTYTKDVTVWHFIVLANPNLDFVFWQLRYEQALDGLGKIQSGKVVPYSWPLATTPEGGDTSFHITSQPRRETKF